jgi:hypothetical protein
MTPVSSLLSIKPAMLPASMLRDYTTSVFNALLFSSSYRPVGNLFLITSLLELLFLLSFWTIILAILPAMMLGYYS